MSHPSAIFSLGKELSDKPLSMLSALRAIYDPRSVALKEYLPAMKDTVGSGGSLFIKSPVRANSMPNGHITGVFDAQGSSYQAICSCGWLSTLSYLEEVDLLRAIHAHEVSVFGDRR